MLGIFKYEFKRIFRDRKNLIFFLILLLISLYFVHAGIKNYEELQAEKIKFCQNEKDLLKYYRSYKQYRDFGFRLMAESSPLNIFFGATSIWGNLRAHVDTTPAFEIFDSSKGKLFYKGYFKDFSGMIYFIGSLLMMYLGVTGIRSLDWLKFKMQFVKFPKLLFTSTISRLFFANLFFALIFSLALLYTMMHSIHFSWQEILNYIFYSIFTLILLTFFYLSGLLIAALLRFKNSSFVWMIFIWLLFTFFVPVLNRMDLEKGSMKFREPEGVYMENMKELLEFEEEAENAYAANKKNQGPGHDKMVRKLIKKYRENSLITIENREKGVSADLKKRLQKYEIGSLWFPTMFHNSMAAEVSSKGYQSYLDFRKSVLDVQKGFIYHYFDEYYLKKSEEVKGYLKSEEQVIRTKSSLPRLYWIGVLSTLIYCFIFAVLMFLVLKFQIYRD